MVQSRVQIEQGRIPRCERQSLRRRGFGAGEIVQPFEGACQVGRETGVLGMSALALPEQVGCLVQAGLFQQDPAELVECIGLVRAALE